MKTRRRTKQELFVLAALFAFAFAQPLKAFAYGEQITQAGIALYTWLRGLGAVIMCIGFAGVGFKLMVAHDREGLKPFYYVIGGGLIMMLGPSIVQLIQGVSGGAAAINTSGS